LNLLRSGYFYKAIPEINPPQHDFTFLNLLMPYDRLYSWKSDLNQSEQDEIRDIALRAGLVTLCLYEHLIWTQLQVREL